MFGPSKVLSQAGPRWTRAALLGVSIAAAAGAAQAAGPVPLGAFVQLGSAGGGDTLALTVGTTADWSWRKETGWGLWTGYTEASLGRWRTDQATGERRYTWQVGLTPVLRVYTAGVPAGWFFEGGIGANYIRPAYQRNGKQFSTRWNFGDHLAAGLRFGAQGRDEVALRVQHYSNGGAEKPNPGENFFQLRYLRRFD